MTDFFNAFEMSPVPDGPDAVAPEPYRGIYAMPMFVNVPTNDLEASTDFWVRGLGFINLFSVPGQVVHLRRWAFQDVLLVPAGNDAGAAAAPSLAPMSVSFSCVLGQLESVAAACRELSPDSVTGPYDTPWRTRDISVLTPEQTRVIFTAARPLVPGSAEERHLASMGILAPDTSEEGSQ